MVTEVVIIVYPRPAAPSAAPDNVLLHRVDGGEKSEIRLGTAPCDLLWTTTPQRAGTVRSSAPVGNDSDLRWLGVASELFVVESYVVGPSSQRNVYGGAVNVTLLYFEDCPNWLEADGHLRSLAAEHPEMIVERRLVETDEDAAATQFHGSPSITLDGVDLFADKDAPVGLSCRMYQTSDGTAGSPTFDQLRDAIFGT